MNILFSYLRPSYGKMSVGISIKVLGTLVELALPYILSHILKNVVVKEDIGLIVLWGVVMDPLRRRRALVQHHRQPNRGAASPAIFR